MLHFSSTDLLHDLMQFFLSESSTLTDEALPGSSDRVRGAWVWGSRLSVHQSLDFGFTSVIAYKVSHYTHARLNGIGPHDAAKRPMAHNKVFIALAESFMHDQTHDFTLCSVIPPRVGNLPAAWVAGAVNCFPTVQVHMVLCLC